MANLTITVDDDVLRRARVRASKRNESLSGYLVDALQHYAESDGAEMAVSFVHLARELRTAHVGECRGWSREDLHRG